MAPIKGYILTEEERDWLREFMARDQQQGRNTRNRPHVPREDEIGPEHYLARVGSSDIPSRVGHAVYSAECNIYRILDGQLTAITGLDRVVYNRYPFALRAGTYISVRRDKWGQWIAEHSCCDDEIDTGTGTGTFTDTGTGTGTSEGCDPVTVQETDIRCEEGSLNVYSRTVWIDLVAGCLAKLTGDWTFLREEGCCDCEDTGTDGTSTDETTGTGGTGTADDECQCDRMPDYYSFAVTSFGGSCSVFNRNYKVFRSGGSCTYSVTIGGGGPTATLTITSTGGGNQFTLVLTDPSTGASVTYQGTISDQDCCLSLALTHVHGSCSTRPLQITIWPGTPCEDPTGTDSPGFDTGTSPVDPDTGTDGGGGDTDCCTTAIANTLYATVTCVGTVTLTRYTGGAGPAPIGSGETYWYGTAPIPDTSPGTGLGGCDPGTLYLRFYCPGAFSDSCDELQLEAKCDYGSIIGEWRGCQKNFSYACNCDPLASGPWSYPADGLSGCGGSLCCLVGATLDVTE